jgi:FMN phosphatase YigB (HAD superfamily)
MASSSPRVVCFDLGGVVVRICRSFEEAILAAGLPLRELPSNERSRTAQRDLVAQHQLGMIDGSRFFSSLAQAIGHAYSPDELGRIHRAVLRGEYEGVSELIASIRPAGPVTACLSNTNDDHWRELLQLPSLRALDVRHASHLWGLAKPDPAMYRRFERELGVSPGEILFFDDLEENVAAATGLGWDAVRIDHTVSTAPQISRALADRGVVIDAAAPKPQPH